MQWLLSYVSHISNFTKTMSFILSELYIQFQNKKSNLEISYHKVTYTMQLVHEINFPSCISSVVSNKLLLIMAPP